MEQHYAIPIIFSQRARELKEESNEIMDILPTKLGKTVECMVCGKLFTRGANDLDRHVKASTLRHFTSLELTEICTIPCQRCGLYLTSEEHRYLHEHATSCNPDRINPTIFVHHKSSIASHTSMHDDEVISSSRKLRKRNMTAMDESSSPTTSHPRDEDTTTSEKKIIESWESLAHSRAMRSKAINPRGKLIHRRATDGNYICHRSEGFICDIVTTYRCDDIIAGLPHDCRQFRRVRVLQGLRSHN